MSWSNENSSTGRRSLLQRLRDRLFPAIDPPTPAEIRQRQLAQRRDKPRQRTILRRSTARNLKYLVDHNLTPPFKGDLLVAKSLRRYTRGKYLMVGGAIPSHGV